MSSICQCQLQGLICLHHRSVHNSNQNVFHMCHTCVFPCKAHLGRFCDQTRIWRLRSSYRNSLGKGRPSRPHCFWACIQNGEIQNNKLTLSRHLNKLKFCILTSCIGVQSDCVSSNSGTLFGTIGTSKGFAGGRTGNVGQKTPGNHQHPIHF